MAEQAKAELERSMARRLAAADDQIASAEAAAVKQVRDQAITVAVAAAGDVIAKALQDTDRATLVDDAIKTVEQRLH
jgi:F-type H+-transporting ATPase subunit b